MLRQGLIATALFSAIATGCASSASAPTTTAARPTGLGCDALPTELVQAPAFAEPLRVVRAKAIQETVGRQTVGAKRGAEVAVVAEPGYDVTAVRRILACRADAQRAGGSASDPLAVEGVRVSVSHADQGYSVRLVGSNRAGGSEIWTRVSNLEPR